MMNSCFRRLLVRCVIALCLVGQAAVGAPAYPTAWDQTIDQLHKPFLDGYGRIIGLLPAGICTGTNRIMNQTLVCLNSLTGSPCPNIKMPAISAMEEPVWLGSYTAPVIGSTRLLFLDKNDHYWTADIPEFGDRPASLNMSANRLIYSNSLNCWANPNLVQSRLTVSVACFGGSGTVYGFNTDGEAWASEGVTLPANTVPAFLPNAITTDGSVFPGGVYTGTSLLDPAGAISNFHPDMTAFLAAITVSTDQGSPPFLYQISTGSRASHQRLLVLPLTMLFNNLHFVAQVSKSSWTEAEPAILQERGGWILAVTRGRNRDDDDKYSSKDSSYEIRVFKSMLTQQIEITKSTMSSWVAVGCRQLLDASLVDDAGTVVAVIGCDLEYAVVTIASPWTTPTTSVTLPRSAGLTTDNDAYIVGVRGGTLLLATSMQDGACKSQTVPGSVTALVVNPQVSATPIPSSGSVPVISPTQSATPSPSTGYPSSLPHTKEYTVLGPDSSWFYSEFSKTFTNQSEAMAFMHGSLGIPHPAAEETRSLRHRQAAASSLQDDQGRQQDDQTIWQDDNSIGDDSNDYHMKPTDAPVHDDNSHNDNYDANDDDRHFDDALLPGAESIKVCLSQFDMRIVVDTVVNGKAETITITMAVGATASYLSGIYTVSRDDCAIDSTTTVPAHINRWCAPASIGWPVIALARVESNTVANVSGVLISQGNDRRGWYEHSKRMLTSPVTNVLPRIGACNLNPSASPNPSPYPGASQSPSYPGNDPGNGLSPFMIDILIAVGVLVFLACTCACLARRSGAHVCCNASSKTRSERTGRTGRATRANRAAGDQAYALLPDQPVAASRRSRQTASASLSGPPPPRRAAAVAPPPRIAAAVYESGTVDASTPFSLAAAVAPPPPHADYGTASLNNPGASPYGAPASTSSKPDMAAKEKQLSHQLQADSDFSMEL